MTPDQEQKLSHAITALFEVAQERFEEVVTQTGLNSSNRHVVFDIVAADILTATFKTLPELQNNVGNVEIFARNAAVLGAFKSFKKHDAHDCTTDIEGC